MHPVNRGRLAVADAAPTVGERVTTVAVVEGLTIEHIQSGTLPGPVSFQQDHGEWAVVLAGGAVMEVDGERIRLEPRDWVWIPAGTPHTVERTEPGTEWLALHLPVPPPG